jgi:ABC-type transport system involved in multi-copper enzyme maturation permease subunit
MIPTFWNSLREAVHRRVALVLLGIAVLITIAFNLVVHVRTLPDGGSAIALGAMRLGPAVLAVPAVLAAELSQAGTLWFLLAIFAAAPSLASTVEKGWLEMTLSKGTSRRAVFLGQYLAGVVLYSAMFLVATFPLAIRLWWTTGVETWPVIITLLIETFSFAALLSVAALASLLQKGVALPIMATAAIWFLSPWLAKRQQSYYVFFTSHAARSVLDWVYRILPKCSELDDLCASFIRDGRIASWWPFWSTAIFAFAVLALTLRQLDRKSF